MDPRILDELAARLAQAVPHDVETLQRDLEKNFQAVLGNLSKELDLVTREEFEVQQAVLNRTRAKLETLEQQVERLEQGQAPNTHPPSE